MQRMLTGIVTAALFVAVVGVGPAGAATRVYDARCETLDGQLTFKPALTATPESHRVTVSGDLQECSGSTFSGLLRSPSLACNDAGQIVGEPAVGTVTFVWPEGDMGTSVVHLALTQHPSTNAPLKIAFSGRVKSGAFVGDRVKALALTASPQTCATGITSYGFSTISTQGTESFDFYHLAPN